MTKILTAILTATALNASALSDWVLFTTAPAPTNGITVIDTRLPLKRNDDLRDFVSNHGNAIPSFIPSLVHPVSGFILPAPSLAQMNAREALLAAYCATLTPEKHVRPQSAPEFIIGDTAVGVTTNKGLITYAVGGTPTETAAARVAARTADRLHREALQAIKLDLLQCETNITQVAQALEGINTSATGTLGVAIAAINPALLTGNAKTVAAAQRDALTATRNLIGDLKNAVKNLRQAAEQNRQATEKMRREIK
jgi:hypothetical protein